MSYTSIHNIRQERILEVDLDAIAYNFNYHKSLLKPTTKVLVLLKANAYGLGSVEIAQILENLKVDCLGVLSVSEGVELREAGIKSPIIVLNPSALDLGRVAKFNLEPCIYSFKLLKNWIETVKSTSPKNNIHIKIDTGMHRLGFNFEELEEVISIINKNHLKINSVFTHLAGAENPILNEFTKKQFQILDNACSKIKKETNQEFIKHALNSSGVINFPSYQMDMVRLGIGLYGFNPAKNDANIKPVAALYSVISQIKNLKKGETVGYGRAGEVKSDKKIATINIGYGDGISRQFGNGVGTVYINGEKASIIGNVCMDMLMVDVTKIACEEGDRVEIFGANLTIVEISKQINTIPYEILTSVSQRVKRIYYKY